MPAFSFSAIPPTSSIFAAYASVSSFIMLLQTIFYQLVPRQLQHYLLNKLHTLFKQRRRRCTSATLVVEERDGISSNEIYYAAEIYLCAKIKPNFDRLKVTKRHKDAALSIGFAQSEKITDRFEDIDDLEWRFASKFKNNSNNRNAHNVFDESTDGENAKRYFELRFDSKHKEKVLDYYLPFVLESAKIITDEKKVIKLHTLSNAPYGSHFMWDSVNLEHPSTFETLAMEPSQKAAIVEDLDRFVRRKEFYRKVGKAWKRGYLLYGPPGTGKSSLIAAMANYLKFDVYDLELASIKRDSDLRRLLLRTANRSILVIEDIDCTVALPGRKGPTDGPNSHAHSQLPLNQFTLSGLLNFIDGLWSSCGDERIIVFTTNNKDKLDPALLRPGRMDMHIHMSYLTPEAFKLLAATYLTVDLHQNQRLSEIEDFIKISKITPAEIAEELMKSDNVDTSLDGVLDFLKRKYENALIHDDEVVVDDSGDGDKEEDHKRCKSTDGAMISTRAKCAKRRTKRRLTETNKKKNNLAIEDKEDEDQKKCD
ncbi:hypothetical protein ABFX02_08G236700 [Erythranthe guttata]